MSDEKEITKLIDDYADGRLDPERMRNLLEVLRESAEAQQKLALAAVIERLLKSLAKGPVSTSRIMDHIASGNAEEIEARESVKQKQSVRRPVGSDTAGTGRRRKRWNRASSAYGSGLAALVTIAVMGAVGFGLWQQYKKNTLPEPGRQEVKPPAEHQPERQPDNGNVQVPEPAEPVDQNREPVPKPDTGQHQKVPVVNLTERPVKIFQPTLDELKPPVGDGSDEQGFVPPPLGWEKWVKAEVDESSDKPSGTDLVATTPKAQPEAPVLFVKLREELPSHWNTTPNDLDNLLAEADSKINIRYRVKEALLSEVDPNPEKNPIIYKSGNYHFVFSAAERDMLRKFMVAGGMLVFNSGLGSKPFYESARRELRLIFPETPIQRLSSDHAIFNSFYNLGKVQYTEAVRAYGYKRNDPWFEAVTVNCRTVALISRWDMSIGLEGRIRNEYRAYSGPDAFRLGVNIISYATALRAWAKNYSEAVKFEDLDRTTADKMFIVQMIYDGEWKTRHAGLSILLQSFNRKTAVPVKFLVREMGLTNPSIFNAPLLYITGHENFSLSSFETARLRRYIQSGGFIFAESCCGRRGFDQAFRTEIDKVIPGKKLEVVPPESVIYSNPNRIDRVSVTSSLSGKFRTSRPRPFLEGIKLDGRYVVIYSRFGMAGGWEMSQSPYSDGYIDQDAIRLGQNILMYAITQ